MTNFERRADSSKTKIAAQLRALVLRQDHGAKLPTARALCEQFHISAKTLNAALDELEAQDLIYRVHSVGIFVRAQRVRAIAVAFDARFLLDADRSPFWDALWNCLRAYLQSAGFEARLHLLQVEEDGAKENESNRRFLEAAAKCAGVLGLGVCEAVADELSQGAAPFVAYAGRGAWVVLNDLEAMVAQCVRALAQSGCKTVGLWHPATHRSSFDLVTEEHLERLFRLEAEGAGLQTRSAFIQNPRFALTGLEGAHSSQKQGAALARQMLREGAPWPHGIVVTDDMMTRGMLDVLVENSANRVLDVPVVGRDLQIATHANAGSEVLQDCNDRLIRVEVDPAQIAGAMIQILQQLLAHQTPAARRYYVGQTTHFPTSKTQTAPNSAVDV